LLSKLKKSATTKEYGEGGGVLDLERFNCALRLRWQWYQLRNQNKPLINLEIRKSHIEGALFRACTVILVWTENLAM
jgi:hypothetical protein